MRHLTPRNNRPADECSASLLDNRADGKRGKGRKMPIGPGNSDRAGQRISSSNPGEGAQSPSAGHWRAAALKGGGFRPRTVVDVGVGKGTPQLYETFPNAAH